MLDLNAPGSVFAGVIATIVALGLAGALSPWLPAPGAESRRIGHLDGLRGLLAFMVFLHHFVLSYVYAKRGFWEGGAHARVYTLHGPVAVSLFFMITAYLFWRRLLRANGSLPWGAFFVGRARRIAPLYALHFALLVAVPLSVRGWSRLNDGALSDMLSWAAFTIPGQPDIGGFPMTFRIDAGVPWTLAYEWAFYAALPALALLLRLPRWTLPLALASVAALIPTRLDVPFNDWNSRYLGYFLAGVAVVHVERAAGALTRWFEGPVCSLLGAAALVYVYRQDTEARSLAAGLALTFFFATVAMGNSYFGLLSLKGAVALGRISYSVYLLHGLALYYLFTLARPGLLASLTTPWEVWGAMALTGALVTAVSAATYRWVELPFLAARSAPTTTSSLAPREAVDESPAPRRRRRRANGA